MNRKLAVILLGKQNSGKSSAWAAVFKRKQVATDKIHSLDLDIGNAENIFLRGDRSINVFLINKSCEERKILIDDIAPSNLPRILFCSVQYCINGIRTIEFLDNNDYTLKVMWLNPECNKEEKYFDHDGVCAYLLGNHHEVTLLPGGKGADDEHSQTIAWAVREKVLGWATYQI